MEMKSYACYFSLPKGATGNEKPYRDNKSAMVLAESTLKAVEKVLAIYPEAEIHNINHTGTREIIQ